MRLEGPVFDTVYYRPGMDEIIIADSQSLHGMMSDYIYAFYEENLDQFYFWIDIKWLVEVGEL